MSCVQEKGVSLTYTLLIRSEWVIRYSWEGLNPTILNARKQL